MKDYSKIHDFAKRIKVLFGIFVSLIFVIANLIFYSSEDKNLTVLGIGIIAISLVFAFLLTLLFNRMLEHIKTHHDLLQNEAKILIKRDWHLTQTIEKLKEEKDKVKLFDKLKSEFITITAHQLRTPLTAIKWTLNSMKENAEKLNSEQKEILEKGYQANEKMVALVNKLLNVSFIEESKFTYTLSKYSLKKLIEEIIKKSELLLKEKELRIIFNTGSPSETYEIKMDKEKLMIAINNIIDNAIKYSFPKEPIEINLKIKETKALLSISNKGQGIPQNEQGKIFSKFFRGKKTTRLETEGFGLGLYISKNIIKEHRGEISFESEEGKGTIFYIALPI